MHMRAPVHRPVGFAVKMRQGDGGDDDITRRALIGVVLCALAYEYVVSTRDRFMMLKTMESEMKIGVPEVVDE